MSRYPSTSTPTPPRAIYLLAHSFGDTPGGGLCHTSPLTERQRPPKPSIYRCIYLVHLQEGPMSRLPSTSTPTPSLAVYRRTHFAYLQKGSTMSTYSPTIDLPSVTARLGLWKLQDGPHHASFLPEHPRRPQPCTDAPIRCIIKRGQSHAFPLLELPSYPQPSIY